jgi:hypothetical protein
VPLGAGGDVTLIEGAKGPAFAIAFPKLVHKRQMLNFAPICRKQER